jgi:DNA mismatch repair protein MutL
VTSVAHGPSIRVLPERVRNQIAAGEVVERPASVVKELVENALDAGARELAIDLEEGGARLVRVVDDGRGMGPEDLALAFVSHATSKLSEVDDLAHIATLGFRGEALGSIGSVSRARVLTQRAGEPHGWSVEDEGGAIGPVTAAGARRGTTVEVRELFYNVPARRAFLKRTATELARCLDVLQRLCLAHVGTGFVVTHDGARVFDVEREMDLAARVRRLFGAELAAALVPLAAEQGEVRLTGLVAPPRFSRADTARQMWFLNGRPLRDRVLARCLLEAYRGFNDEKRQPVAFLSLALPPAQVDVNVHPTKSEGASATSDACSRSCCWRARRGRGAHRHGHAGREASDAVRAAWSTRRRRSPRGPAADREELEVARGRPRCRPAGRAAVAGAGAARSRARARAAGAPTTSCAR